MTIRAQDKWIASEKDGKYGYVNSAGETKIPYQYPFVYTDTLTTIAFVALGTKIKAIDRDNNTLFTVFIYDTGPDYVEEGVFRIVNDSTQKMGFANMDGQIVIQPTFDFVYPFSDGLAVFNRGGRVEHFDEYYDMVVGGKCGYIDHQGNIIFPAIFDNAMPFRDKEAIVTLADRRFTISVTE